MNSSGQRICHSGLYMCMQMNEIVEREIELRFYGKKCDSQKIYVDNFHPIESYFGSVLWVPGNTGLYVPSRVNTGFFFYTAVK